ncbi:type II toxin-antitoxin system RelE/ParE family toxin [Candidatus Uhrbacteria bacterium]|nr:type II toxin-antitoxin system RelE/ParE family toxin [Candidatus Uhrbacteria bacterium]
MIKSFHGSEVEKIFNCEYSRKLPTSIQRIALRKLLMLDAAVHINDLRVPPGNRLEKLSGNRCDEYSIRINDQWRICFVWDQGHAYHVSITDYHS